MGLIESERAHDEELSLFSGRNIKSIKVFWRKEDGDETKNKTRKTPSCVIVVMVLIIDFGAS